MSGKYLLDTNIVIALFAKDENVSQKVTDADAVFASSIVVGELLFGALKSGRVKANVERAENFASKTVIVPCDTETAKHYAQIKNDLRLKGKPIPENDIWIATLALQHDLILVTRDAHFGEVDGLTVEHW